MSESKISKLILTAYEAAVEPELWPSFLTQYSDLMKAVVCGFQIHDFDKHHSQTLSFVRLPLELRRSYHDYYTKLNPWRERGRRLYTQGRVLLGQEICPDDLLRRSEFHEFARQIEGVHCTAAIIWRCSNQAMTLTALRGERKGPFDETARRNTQVLLPHLVRVHSLQQKLHIQSASISVLDSLPTAILLLGPGARVLYSNTAAEHLLRNEDGLFLRKGVLFASDAKADSTLQHSVRAAMLFTGSPEGSAAFLIPRPSMRRDYQILVSPLLQRVPQFQAMIAPTVAVLITDPYQQTSPADSVCRMYGLTRTEAKLAIELAMGLSLREVATSSGIQYETARTHLRRIFAKTDTKRQSELVLLIRRLPHIQERA